MFNIVLVAPQIPQNTGTIGRLCVCVDARLHLIKPLGFDLDESRIRRAGMDYWHFLDLTVYENWDAFESAHPGARFLFASTKGDRSIYTWRYTPGDFLVFGNEGSGLPPELYVRYTDSLRTIPMPGRHARSHNLANSVSIALYEGLRQVNGWS
ncbi:MAG: tRNA (cytidine(34)-2'-O)-methyltransferase [Lentisphaeria bacterium]|nr:tRNA (cytidine(34)-2'-O)-methyltransferase [Lentisphaeria bacterium]